MNKFKKIFALSAVAALSVGLVACGADGSSGDEVLIVGASPTPHAQILKYVEDNLAKNAGLNLKIVEYQDYVKPNDDLKAGDIDANYFQTPAYLENQSKERGYDFVAGKGIHLEPLGIYSDKIKNVKDVKDGDSVVIISDPTNQARALKLLADNNLIVLPKDPAEQLVAKVQSSDEYNPKHLKFTEVDGPLLVQTLPDATIGVINGNFALNGGKKPSDAIALESSDGNPAVNILVWAKNSKKQALIDKLEKLLHSDKVKEYIVSTWSDKSVIPTF